MTLPYVLLYFISAGHDFPSANLYLVMFAILRRLFLNLKCLSALVAGVFCVLSWGSGLLCLYFFWPAESVYMFLILWKVCLSLSWIPIIFCLYFETMSSRNVFWGLWMKLFVSEALYSDLCLCFIYLFRNNYILTVLLLWGWSLNHLSILKL